MVRFIGRGLLSNIRQHKNRILRNISSIYFHLDANWELKLPLNNYKLVIIAEPFCLTYEHLKYLELMLRTVVNINYVQTASMNKTCITKRNIVKNMVVVSQKYLSFARFHASCLNSGGVSRVAR